MFCSIEPHSSTLPCAVAAAVCCLLQTRTLRADSSFFSMMRAHPDFVHLPKIRVFRMQHIGADGVGAGEVGLDGVGVS